MSPGEGYLRLLRERDTAAVVEATDAAYLHTARLHLALDQTLYSRQSIAAYFSSRSRIRTTGAKQEGDAFYCTQGAVCLVVARDRYPVEGPGTTGTEAASAQSLAMATVRAGRITEEWLFETHRETTEGGGNLAGHALDIGVCEGIAAAPWHAVSRHDRLPGSETIGGRAGRCLDAFHRRWNCGDHSAWKALYAESAELEFGRHAPIKGREEIAGLLSPDLEQFRFRAIFAERVVAAADGDRLAMLWRMIAGADDLRPSRARVHRTGLSIWQLDKNGLIVREWSVHQDPVPVARQGSWQA